MIEISCSLLSPVFKSYVVDLENTNSCSVRSCQGFDFDFIILSSCYISLSPLPHHCPFNILNPMFQCPGAPMRHAAGQ